VKKLYIIIPTNRFLKLHKKTVDIIEKTKTPTIFVKQNIPLFYKNHPYIKEISSHKSGVSKARNLGIITGLKLGAQIIAFTDDDCIITKKWINNIQKTFSNPKIDIVFGRTLPYQPKKHFGEFCPCTFSKNNQEPISDPVSTWQQAGLSNNFAITPRIIHRVGYFSPNLGPGTKIPGGEDADFIIRVLKNNFLLYYDSQILLYHNKWISKSKLQYLYRQYTFSFAYIYSYHSIHTSYIYFIILFKEFIHEISHYFRYILQIFHPFAFIRLIFNQSLIVYNFIKGFLLSFTYP